MKKKITITIICAILSCVCLIGTTFAWLVDKTDPVENTFTIGNINIDLKETTGNTYKILPGMDIPKDPKVIVEGGSEVCWLFVKIDKSTNFDDVMTYEIATGWTELQQGVYYIKVDTVNAGGNEYPVLKDNKVVVPNTLTKSDIDAITSNPTLTFTAYAIQQEGFATPEAAWAEAKNAT